VLLLGTAALALALTGPGALDNLKLLPFERRFQERDHADLMPSRS
jgi:hypothetical protein